MIRAIDEYDITGIKTTLAFGKFVMQHNAFKGGNFDTHFVSKYFSAESLKNEDEDEALMAALIAVISLKKPDVVPIQNQVEVVSNWRKNRVKFN